VTWRALKLAAPVPAHVASSILPHFQRWRRYVEPIFDHGDIVGVRISSLMSPRMARRLRAKVEPFLRMAAGAAPSATPEPASATAGRRLVSLTKYGLRIPARNAMRARSMLERLADIELQYDSDEEDVVALFIPPGTPSEAIYAIFEVDVVTVEPSSPGHRQHLLGLLHEELEAVAEMRRRA
jgi:hypothetical protein